MPAVSKAQQRYMGMLAHNPERAKKEGVPVAVAKEFASTKQKGLPEHKLRPKGSEPFTNAEFGQGYRVVREKK